MADAGTVDGFSGMHPPPTCPTTAGCEDVPAALQAIRLHSNGRRQWVRVHAKSVLRVLTLVDHHNPFPPVQATYYKDCDRTLLVFFWSHTLCDFDGAMAFLTHWLRATATASTGAAVAARCDADAAVKVVKQRTCAGAKQQQAADCIARPFERVAYFSRPSGLVPTADTVAGACCCRHGCTQPCWPPTEATAAAAAAAAVAATTQHSSGGSASRCTSSSSSSSRMQQACQEWLANHNCPFPVSSICPQQHRLSS